MTSKCKCKNLPDLSASPLYTEMDIGQWPANGRPLAGHGPGQWPAMDQANGPGGNLAIGRPMARHKDMATGQELS